MTISQNPPTLPVMSVTRQRKGRERAEREGLILEHGRRLLLRDGFQNLNLDELARSIDYSKGTIYLHFETKEDLALAIAIRALKERADLFDRASKFTGRTRERMRAVSFACCQFAMVHRDYFNIEMTLRSLSFWEKTSAERRRLHGLEASRLFHVINAIAVDAVRVGDLPEGTQTQEVTLSLIAVTMGSHIAAMQPDIQMLCAIDDPLGVVRRHQELICDGWGWKPLRRAYDYAATDRRIKAEIFPEATWFNGS